MCLGKLFFENLIGEAAGFTQALTIVGTKEDDDEIGLGHGTK